MSLLDVINGKAKAEEELNGYSIKKISSWGAVNKLRVLPLIDYYAENDDLKTEPGISYLIEADDTSILLDFGLNKNKEHPSPLLQNIDKLGVSTKDINMFFISHAHLDHLGGMYEQKNALFSLSQGTVELPPVTAYAPVELKPSKWNLGPKVEVIKEPKVLGEGIASIGSIPRYLFLMGHTLEHSLAINVKGKGIILIVGCGHQTTSRIIERTKKTFDEPIYGIIGGLHFPVNGGRIMLGSLNIQNIVGSDNFPFIGIREQEVHTDIELLIKENLQFIALSPHDSSDWSIALFKEAFKEKYHELKVGKEIIF
jgi:7,8-dihydropterin-6-yl-methyl-4-(beta-D-ribofuranosyl)aminobenzene 5'-phosphate synthase